MALELPLGDPDFYRGDPFPGYARLRREDPVHWHSAGGWWALTRHADIRWVSRNPGLFTSTRGVSIPVPGRPAAPPSDPGALLFQDPPRHRQLRRLIREGFRPRRLARMESRIRSIACDVLDALAADAASVDFAREIAAPLPAMVIAELLGAPPEHWPQLIGWSDAVNAAQDPDEPQDASEARAAIHAYFQEIIEARRSEPRDDLVSTLLAATLDGERLTEPEIHGFCWLLLIAGNETTRNLIALGTLALIENPLQLQRLRARPAELPRAIEEMLRWCNPVTHMARTATRDVSLRGRRIRDGELVVMLYGAANRDEEVFGPDAESFDAMRDPNPHLGFGIGEHFCIGANLARLEARVMFEELLRRFGRIELAGEVQRMRASMTPAVKRMPVRLRDAGGATL
jgi:cytochrome P450